MENLNKKEQDDKQVIEVQPEEVKKGEVVGAEQLKPVVCPAPKRPNIIIGTLNVFTRPAKALAGPAVEYAKARYEKHYHPRLKHGRKHLIIDIGLAAITVALAVVALVAWRSEIFFFAPNIDLKISLAPAVVRSGDEVSFLIEYNNVGEADLDAVKLSVKLPEYFSFKKAIPEASFNENINTFVIGHLEPASNGKVKIVGQAIGESNKEQEFSTTISCLEAGESKRRQKTEKFFYYIRGSSLSVNWQLPEYIFDNQIFDFEINYHNDSKQPMKDLLLKPEWPIGFNIISSEPEFKEGAWLLGEIAAAGQAVIRASGSISGLGQAAKEFKLDSFLALGHDQIWQGSARQSLAVYYPKLTANLKINGRDNIDIGWDRELEYIISYENKEDVNILDLNLAINFDKKIFDLNSLAGDKPEYRDGKLFWNKDNFTSLALVAKGVKGEVRFKVKTKLPDNLKEIFKEDAPWLKTQVMGEYRLEPTPNEIIPFGSSILESRINTNLNVRSLGRYYTIEGDQLGRGPLPPEVDLKTRYWIFLNIINSISDIEDVVVSAYLPEYMEWTGKTSVTLGEPMKFDPVTRQASWRVNKVSKYTGDVYPDVGAAFEVALTPIKDQIGTSPVLLNDVKITAKDSFTGEYLTMFGEDITTDLKYDQRARNKGKVVLE